MQQHHALDIKGAVEAYWATYQMLRRDAVDRDCMLYYAHVQYPPKWYVAYTHTHINNRIILNYI